MGNYLHISFVIQKKMEILGNISLVDFFSICQHNHCCRQHKARIYFFKTFMHKSHCLCFFISLRVNSQCFCHLSWVNHIRKKSVTEAKTWYGMWQEPTVLRMERRAFLCLFYAAFAKVNAYGLCKCVEKKNYHWARREETGKINIQVYDGIEGNI